MFHDSEKPLPRLIQQYSDRVAIVLGFVFNTILLIIVKTNKKSELKSFGQIVFMNCILDLYLNFTTLFTEMQCEAYNGVIYFFINSFMADLLPAAWQYALVVCIWALGIGFSVFYTWIPFYHRYQLICNGEVISRKHVITILMIPVIFSSYIIMSQFLAFLDGANQRDELAKIINTTLWRLPDGSVPMFAAFPIKSIPAKFYLVNCFVCFPASFGLTFYFFSRIYHSFHLNKSNMSDRAIKLHKSLNRALISQAFFPFLLGVFPVTIVMSTLMFHFDIPLMGLIATGTLSWIPAVNPFLTMLLVPAYFRALLPKRILNKVTSVVDTNT